MAPAQMDNMPTAQVFQGQGALLVTPRGDPVPPQSVVAQLQRVDPGLSIEWVAGALGTHYFGLFQRWRQGDPRWQHVQQGEIPEQSARDLVQMFPRECPTHEMAAWVERQYGQRAIADPRAEADKLVARAQQLYAQAQEQGIERVVETGTQRIEDESDHARLVRGGMERAHPMVPGGFEPSEPKRLLMVEKP